MTFVDAAREGLVEEMARDARIFVVGEGIGPRGGNFNTTLGLYDLYGEERLRDAPISERGFTNLCTGAAATGTRPIVDFMFIDFLADAFGDMFNQMAKLQWMSRGRLKLPIVVRGCVGAAPSNAAHHSGNYYPFFMHIPGFRVVMPSTPADAKGLLKTALRSDDPVLFLEHKNLLTLKGPVPAGEYLIPFGQAVVRRAGTDLTLVGIGFTVQQALDAAEQLAAAGVSAEVIDPRTLAPLDIDTILASVHKTGRLLVVDEDFAPCGVGAEIAAQVMERAFDDLDAPVRRVNGLFAPRRTARRSTRRWCRASRASSRLLASCWRSEGRRTTMPFEVVLPRLGWNMETGRLGEWLKKGGERVEAGELLFTVEGDKATQEVEALDSGILHIPPDSPPPGQEVPVGTLLAYLLAPGENVETGSSKLEAGTAQLAAITQVLPATSFQQPASSDQPPTISPRARRVAGELGVDWTGLTGSGRSGRIVERDVRQAAAAAATRPRLSGSARSPGTWRANWVWTRMHWPLGCPAGASSAPILRLRLRLRLRPAQPRPQP